MVNLAINDFSEADLLKINENGLSKNLMKSLLPIDLYTFLKGDNKKTTRRIRKHTNGCLSYY